MGKIAKTQATTKKVQRTNSLQSLIELAKKYRVDMHRASGAHHIMWEKRNGRSNTFGIITTVSATVVGTTIFISINSSPDLILRICAGIISIAAAVFSALQTFLKLPESATAHKIAGNSYAGIKRTLEVFIMKYQESNPNSKPEAMEDLEKIVERINSVAAESPGTPKEAIWKSKYLLDTDSLEEY